MYLFIKSLRNIRDRKELKNPHLENVENLNDNVSLLAIKYEKIQKQFLKKCLIKETL